MKKLNHGLVQRTYKMDIESLKVKNKSYYFWDDTVYIYDFDINLVKIIKRESRIGANIYYIGYMLKPDYDNAINPLYLLINRLFSFIEQIERSGDRYLVVITGNEKVLWKFIENKITSDDSINKIKELIN